MLKQEKRKMEMHRKKLNNNINNFFIANKITYVD